MPFCYRFHDFSHIREFKIQHQRKDLIVSIDEPVSRYEGHFARGDLIPALGLSVECQVEYNIAFNQMREEFTPWEMELLNNFIGKEHTGRELAEMYGTSHTNYRRWEKAVKEKARRILTGTLS